MIKVTQVTARVPRVLSKRYELQNGELNIKPGGHMTEGFCNVIEIADMHQFAELIAGLRSNEALIYGVPKGLDTARIVTKEEFELAKENGKPGIIARTNDCFEWPDGPGIFMIDYDPDDGGTALSKNELLELFEKICPELNGVPKVWWASSSSHICTEGGADLTGLRGQRIYVPVSDARKIPELSKAFEARFWAAGHGYIRISKSGTCLKRTPMDHAVYQPNRLDIAAGASTGEGLKQMRGAPEVVV
ncbi:hypothetical protein [Primorskyibacter sp. S187A]|uniref:hypothetical protein n=1 Tax=Primorskyibacter sp. S187A TaxID=3415130 RepID=UPI003C7EAD77